MHAVGVQEQPFLRGPPERRAVRHRCAEIGLPGVEVGIEVNQGDRPEPLPDHPEQGEGDRVVAADGQQVPGPLQQLRGAGLDLVDGLVDVERVAGDVAGVGDLLGDERPDAKAGMPGAQQPRTLPDRGQAEPGPGPVRRAAVERNADHGHVATRYLIAPGQQGELGGPAKRGVRLASIGPRTGSRDCSLSLIARSQPTGVPTVAACRRHTSARASR